jgi:hypothetical protein
MGRCVLQARKYGTNLMHKYLHSYNIIILNMFRALLCSSSGGQIVYVQHLVPSLWKQVSGLILLKHSLPWYCNLWLSWPVPINSLDFNTIDYNITADYVLVILDHSLAFRVTVPDAVHIQFDLLKMDIIMFETCRGVLYYMNEDICALSW